MATKAVTTDQFESLIFDNDLVFIDFWADPCAPCKPFASVFEQVAAQYPDIVFATINLKDEPQLGQMFQILTIPHLMVFKQGIAIYSESGSMPESALTALVNQALEVDVSDIQAQLEQPMP